MQEKTFLQISSVSVFSLTLLFRSFSFTAVTENHSKSAHGCVTTLTNEAVTGAPLEVEVFFNNLNTPPDLYHWMVLLARLQGPSFRSQLLTAALLQVIYMKMSLREPSWTFRGGRCSFSPLL